MMKRYIWSLLLFTTLLWLSACRENFSDDPTLKLSFSTDTLCFDTVFTTIGSTTARVMIYNTSKKDLKISNISLGKGASSYFRINVDGMANAENSISDVEILKNDSLFLFVEVTVDPNNQNTPIYVEDCINFSTNGNAQKIQLEAYGQDVEIFRQKMLYNDTTLEGEKPYLVYDYIAIDTAKTLTLKAGCKFYFHDQAQFVVYGNLKAEGTLEKPISMRGDRLDYMLENVPYNYTAGQWDGLYLIQVAGKPGFVHQLDYVEITSGTVGIYLLGADSHYLPTLNMNNSRLHNFTQYALVAQNANVEVVNTEISNSASYCVYLAGGTHKFVHNTIANYFGSTNAISQTAERDTQNPTPAVFIYNLSKQTAAMHTQFINCVVSGSVATEFSLATPFPQIYDGVFQNNYLRCDSLLLPQAMDNSYYQTNDTVFRNTYVKYNDYTYYNFELDSVSPARGIADKTTAAQFPLDRNGKNRMADGEPDAGAYEYEYEESSE